MSDQFVVIISDGRGHVPAVLGPFADREDAERFAAFATAEIDPAEVRTLCPPVAELLNWRDATLTNWREADGGTASGGMCDSCTCCTAQDCVPAKCGEDDYGRFHCPCTAE